VPADARYFPLGDQATLIRDPPGSLQGGRTILPVLLSHTCTVPSSLADAKSVVFGFQATLLTAALWPEYIISGVVTSSLLITGSFVIDSLLVTCGLLVTDGFVAKVRASHTLTVLSALADANFVPSEFQMTLFMIPLPVV
jgi:hypothetical protein